MGGRGSKSSRDTSVAAESRAGADLTYEPQDFYVGMDASHPDEEVELTYAAEMANAALEQNAMDNARRQSYLDWQREAYGPGAVVTDPARGQIANENAARTLWSAKAPTERRSIEVRNADGAMAVIFKATPAYRRRDGANSPMYGVDIRDANGERLFRTNRYGSGALSTAKDDVARVLGLRPRGRRRG